MGGGSVAGIVDPGQKPLPKHRQRSLCGRCLGRREGVDVIRWVEEPSEHSERGVLCETQQHTGMLGHVTCRALRWSLAILMTTYAHIARFVRYAHYVRDIPGTQDEPLGFAVTCRALWRSLAPAARVMDDILTPIPIELRMLEK